MKIEIHFKIVKGLNKKIIFNSDNVRLKSLVNMLEVINTDFYLKSLSEGVSFEINSNGRLNSEIGSTNDLILLEDEERKLLSWNRIFALGELLNDKDYEYETYELYFEPFSKSVNMFELQLDFVRPIFEKSIIRKESDEYLLICVVGNLVY